MKSLLSGILPFCLILASCGNSQESSSTSIDTFSTTTNVASEMSPVASADTPGAVAPDVITGRTPVSATSQGVDAAGAKGTHNSEIPSGNSGTTTNSTKGRNNQNNSHRKGDSLDSRFGLAPAR